jgi:hypothetical protein
VSLLDGITESEGTADSHLLRRLELIAEHDRPVHRSAIGAVAPEVIETGGGRLVILLRRNSQDFGAEDPQRPSTELVPDSDLTVGFQRRGPGEVESEMVVRVQNRCDDAICSPLLDRIAEPHR